MDQAKPMDISESHRTKRVLALDDDGVILRVIDSALKMNDYECVTASQWVEALDAIDDCEPDLLLLDLQMPHVDGVFLLEWMREQNLNFPVIVVSAYLDADSVARFNEMGVDGFVWKPFEISGLIQEIDRCIGRNAAGGNPKADEFSVSMETKEATPVESPAIVDEIPMEEAASVEGPRQEPAVHRFRGRRRHRSHAKRLRRRNILYFGLVALACLFISGITVIARRMVPQVRQAIRIEQPVEGDQLIQAIIQSRVNAQLRRAKPTIKPEKLVEIDLREDLKIRKKHAPASGIVIK